MSKRKIILLSIIGLIIVLNIYMFGFVFRLKNQSVKVVGENVLYSAEEIVSASELKNGKSIFLLDKQQAIDNIERKYADLKVIQIKTTNINSIEIYVRARYETYLVKNNGMFYILDEDLKVLEKTSNEDYVNTLNLVEIKTGLENFTESTQKCDFIGNSVQKDIFYNLYVSIHSNTTISKDLPTGTESHNTMREIINSVSVNSVGAKDGSKDSILTIETTDGIKFIIHNANSNLVKKFDACFQLMNDSSKIQDKTKGGIELYTLDGTEASYKITQE